MSTVIPRRAETLEESSESRESFCLHGFMSGSLEVRYVEHVFWSRWNLFGERTGRRDQGGGTSSLLFSGIGVRHGFWGRGREGVGREGERSWRTLADRAGLIRERIFEGRTKSGWMGFDLKIYGLSGG